jgi:hypothetical protein
LLATKKGFGGDDNDDGDDDDDENSDGFLVIDDETNDVQAQDVDDADVESYSSWNEVDMIQESTPPTKSPLNTATTTTVATLSTISREQQIRCSSLNYDGYLEVDNDDGKVDTSGHYEKTGSRIQKSSPTVIFDATPNNEGDTGVCPLHDEAIQDTNKAGSDAVVLERVSMLGKNTRGRIFFRIVLLLSFFTSLVVTVLILAEERHRLPSWPPGTQRRATAAVSIRQTALGST